MVNYERLGRVFQTLAEIDSVSKKEGAICKHLKEIFGFLGAEVVIDRAGQKVDGNTGNLIAKLQGTAVGAPPLLLNAHMDTVQPGEGVRVRFSEGSFSSDGTTVLGADDKSALAVIIETISLLKEKKLPFGPLEVVVTICEEIGLLGAKNLDYSRIESRYGYCLDATDTDGIVTRAPAANRIEFKVHGLAAHAGAAPEKGINAIKVACGAISKASVGRIDEETTANIGLIEGGRATNIVPDLVRVAGEVRSHSLERLREETERIVRSFEDEVAAGKKASPVADGLPRLETKIRQDFPAMKIAEDHPVVQLARKAASRLGREMKTKTGGGGSDANIFCEQGIVTGILGTGMKDVHTLQESVRLDDMVKSVQLLLEIIQVHAEEG